MIPTALIILAIIIYLESSLLKGLDFVMFKEVFRVSIWLQYLLIALTTIGVVLAVQNNPEAVILLIVGFILPFYLLRRDRFLNQLSLNADSTAVMLIDAYGIILIWFFSQVVLSFVLAAFIFFMPGVLSELWELMVSAVCSFMILLILIKKASAKFSDKGFWHNVGFHQDKGSFFKVYFWPTLTGLGFAFLSAHFIVAREVQPQTPLSEVLTFTQSPAALLGFVVLAVMVAPLVEEIIFRGYFFHVVKEIKGQGFAICFIALVFAALHIGQYWGDWLGIGVVGILGFVLTGLRAWTGTTAASVVTHYVYNGGVMVITAILMILKGNFLG